MTIRKVTFILTTAVVCVLMTSCGSTRQIVYMQGADSAYVLPKQIPQQFELKVQPDDQLAITIATKTKESLRPFVNTYLMGSGDNTVGTSSTANVQAGVTYYIVDKSGNISFPVFGDINVNGKTCKEISADIQNRLSAGGYLFDAVVNTKIMSFKVTVLGDVKNPGVQTYTGERLTVLEAIGRAGDLESSAKRENVLVVREENGKRVTYTIDLRDQHSIFASPAYYMQQNDLVYVQPNKSVRVKGSAGYLYLSIGATIVGMLASIASLAIALTK